MHIGMGRYEDYLIIRGLAQNVAGSGLLYAAGAPMTSMEAISRGDCLEVITPGRQTLPRHAILQESSADLRF